MSTGRDSDEAPDPRWRPSRNLKVLSAVSFTQDCASDMLYPLLPVFLTTVLGAPVVAVGAAEGLADAASVVTKLVAGRLARVHRRRRWIAAGYGLAAIGKVIVAVSFVWPLVLLGRVVDRFGKGMRGVPRDAMIADDETSVSRGRAFGFHRSFDTLGAVIGPLGGLALLHVLDDRIRPVLVIALIPAMVSVVLVALLREHEPRDAPPAGVVLAPNVGMGERRRLPRQYWRAMLPLGVFALVNSTDALLLQRASELGLSISAVIVCYVLYNLVYAALGYPAGAWADRVSPRAVYMMGLVVFAVVYLGLGLATSSTLVWLLLPVYGAFTALTDGVSRAWVANLVASEDRTWALGAHGAMTGVGALFAGVWSGLAWGGSGRLPLAVSGCVALVVALWLLVGTRRGTFRNP